MTVAAIFTMMALAAEVRAGAVTTAPELPASVYHVRWMQGTYRTSYLVWAPTTQAEPGVDLVVFGRGEVIKRISLKNTRLAVASETGFALAVPSTQEDRSYEVFDRQGRSTASISMTSDYEPFMLIGGRLVGSPRGAGDEQPNIPYNFLIPGQAGEEPVVIRKVGVDIISCQPVGDNRLLLITAREAEVVDLNGKVLLTHPFKSNRQSAFPSPDGNWIVFPTGVQHSELISLGGGAPVGLSASPRYVLFNPPRRSVCLITGMTVTCFSFTGEKRWGANLGVEIIGACETSWAGTPCVACVCRGPAGGVQLVLLSAGDGTIRGRVALEPTDPIRPIGDWPLVVRSPGDNAVEITLSSSQYLITARREEPQ